MNRLILAAGSTALPSAAKQKVFQHGSDGCKLEDDITGEDLR